jgi:hypothetical protein
VWFQTEKGQDPSMLSLSDIGQELMIHDVKYSLTCVFLWNGNQFHGISVDPNNVGDGGIHLLFVGMLGDKSIRRIRFNEPFQTQSKIYKPGWFWYTKRLVPSQLDDPDLFIQAITTEQTESEAIEFNNPTTEQPVPSTTTQSLASSIPSNKASQFDNLTTEQPAPSTTTFPTQPGVYCITSSNDIGSER